MARFVQIFLMGMGVIFTILLGVGGYIYISDTFHVRSIVAAVLAPAPTLTLDTDVTSTASSTDEGTTTPALVPVTTHAAGAGTAAQRQAFASAGITGSAISGGVTQTEITCFIKGIGLTRALAIKGGEVPTATELTTIKSCLTK